MLKAAVLLALLSTEPVEVRTLPPGTVITVQATVCFRKSDIDQIVDAEIKTGTGHEVYTALDGCNNYCIKAAVVREERRFLHQKKQLFAVFEVIGLAGSSQSFWVATAILPNGLPVPVPQSVHAARCVETLARHS
jgi:hypothetical protein